MNRAQNPNLEILTFAVAQLGELADEMVFLGGCATGLLITDSAAPPIRQTQDVDAIVQVVSRAEYYQLAKKLRTKGFTEDTSDGAPICRWKTDKVTMDIMPTDTQILGFGNNWYGPAVEHAETISLYPEKQIRLVSGPYFLITKLEAYEGRGAGDYQMSHDIEDIVAVLDGRPGIAEEVKRAEPDLRQELSDRFITMLNDKRFVEAVSGHMPTDDTSQARVPIIMKVIEVIAGKK
jgi:predicted nucleotidyltransferase